MLTLKTNPSPILRKIAKEVKEINEKDFIIFLEMHKLMKRSKGIGIAAPQIGLSVRMIVVDVDNNTLFLANPKILKTKGKANMQEGCLSCPNEQITIERAEKIEVQALNENNEDIRFIAEGLIARVIQHEIDHLNGKMIIDYKK